VGIAMGLLFQFSAGLLLPMHLYWAAIISLAIVTAISYGWELLSKITGKGHYEIMDAVFSIIGGLVGMGIMALAWHQLY